ncbi:hypothetical protein GCM10011491_36270 [Brucella endophytica]|uniref:Uncharacterized protein n=1 Tax=Brucella endophytica TaxID=1963359 RepID=A0A916SKH8_9HYPH|nr:hypothetical protein [Brucella endophytica]GGB04889.1 hypothetical protein GCM10011491_36270 [Brucella endophytica]
MNKIILTLTTLIFGAGVAFAENPSFGTPDDLYAKPSAPVAQPKTDYTAPASIGTIAETNPAARRFGDASPANQQ